MTSKKMEKTVAGMAVGTHAALMASYKSVQGKMKKRFMRKPNMADSVRCLRSSGHPCPDHNHNHNDYASFQQSIEYRCGLARASEYTHVPSFPPAINPQQLSTPHIHPFLGTGEAYPRFTRLCGPPGCH